MDADPELRKLFAAFIDAALKMKNHKVPLGLGVDYFKTVASGKMQIPMGQIGECLMLRAPINKEQEK